MMVDVTKAIGINFTATSKLSVEDTMNVLKLERSVSLDGKYDDNYFELNKDERALVNSRAEEAFLSTRMLLLACNKAHYRSK